MYHMTKPAISKERYINVQKPGNLNEFSEEISKKTNIPYEEVIKQFPKVILKLGVVHQEIARMYYIMQMTPINISFKRGRGLKQTEKSIEVTKRQIINKFSKMGESMKKEDKK